MNKDHRPNQGARATPEEEYIPREGADQPIPEPSRTSETTTKTTPPPPPPPQDSHHPPSSAATRDAQSAVAKHVRFQQQGEARTVDTPTPRPPTREADGPEEDPTGSLQLAAPKAKTPDDEEDGRGQRQGTHTEPEHGTPQQFRADLPPETRERMVRSGADAQIVRAELHRRHDDETSWEDDCYDGRCSIL